jgi:DNA invertase Pin-like site-specific DNA recombinase
MADTGSGASLPRPLAEALDRRDRGEVDLLLAAKLDRISRSVKDFPRCWRGAIRRGWRLVLLDLGDTSTATGELNANMIASAAQYERRLIGQRTREGLAAKRAAGVRLGCPSVLLREIVERVVTERRDGRSMRVIAEGLTAAGVPTARGGTEWRVSPVQAVLNSQNAAALTAVRADHPQRARLLSPR